MGFENTVYKDTVDHLVSGLKDRLNNPFYLFTDKKPTVVDYYNTNTKKSTLDEGAKISYGALGNDSPKRYNIIRDALLYGLERISVDLDIGDFGLESSPITGNGYVLPNTWEPYAEDYFVIKYTDKSYVFKVTAVSPDTLENGSNFFRIDYVFEQFDDGRIKDQIADEYRMIVNNVGTNFNAIIRSSLYDYMNKIELLSDTLKIYFQELFFRTKIQTYVFSKHGFNFYDPYMVEFLRRNKILKGSESDPYIAQQIYLPSTFILEYNNSLFRALELCDKENIENRYRRLYSYTVTDINSLMYVRIEPYYAIQYNEDKFCTKCEPNPHILTSMPDHLIQHIMDNELYTENELLIYNIFVRYFNNMDITQHDIDAIENINYNQTVDLFYYIPMAIAILENTIKKLLITSK